MGEAATHSREAAVTCGATLRQGTEFWGTRHSKSNIPLLRRRPTFRNRAVLGARRFLLGLSPMAPAGLSALWSALVRCGLPVLVDWFAWLGQGGFEASEALLAVITSRMGMEVSP